MLNQDERFKNSTIYQTLYKQDMKELSKTDMNNIHTVSEMVWQYWPRITIVSVQQYLEAHDTRIVDTNNEGPFAILRLFLSKVCIMKDMNYNMSVENI